MLEVRVNHTADLISGRLNLHGSDYYLGHLYITPNVFIEHQLFIKSYWPHTNDNAGENPSGKNNNTSKEHRLSVVRLL